MTGKSITVYKKDLIFFIVFIALFVLSIAKHVDTMFTLCFTSYCAILFLAFRQYKKNIVFCSFLITIFAFLFGSPVATLLLGSKYDVHFSDDAKHHLYFTLFLSVIFVGIGYMLFSKVKFSHDFNETSDSMRLALRKTSKIFFYITYALKVIQYMEIGYYVIKYGYMFFYTEYKSAIPLIIEKISDLYIVALSIFLATNPSRKEYRPVMTAFLIGGVFSVITGKRYEFVYVIMLYFIYMILRSWQINDNQQEETWFSNKKFALIIIGIPLMITFLMFVGAIRSKSDFEFSSLKDIILDFMVDIGNSGKVIMRGFQYKSVIPEGRFYSFGSIIEYLKYNYFSKKILGVNVPNPRTYEYVTSGHSFAYVITYYFSADSFYSGHGQGSSYIAELFADFGYFGVAFGSFILGAFISQVFKFSGKSVVHDSFLYFLIRPLLFCPRDTFCLPLSYFINVKYLLAFAIIFTIAKQLNRTNDSLSIEGGYS